MSEILLVDPLNPDPRAIERAAAMLRAGEVVGIPTDTVYGLASDALNEAACEKVFALKRRQATEPLLILVDSLEMAFECAADFPPIFRQLAKHFWPGPLTIVVKAAAKIPVAVTAGKGTVGIRLPASLIAQRLIGAVGGPITASSANRSGEAECRSAQQVKSAIGVELKMILDSGDSPLAVPSTVVSVADGDLRMLREGAISEKAICDFLRPL